MNKKVKIAHKIIGNRHPCFIIAEAGSNHNGSLKQALDLIDVAVEAGADAVKFQTFKAEKLYVRTAGKSRYLKTRRSIFDIIQEMEMSTEWIPLLARHCKKSGIIFLSTPFDEESVELLDPHVPAFKIASYEMTAIPLVEYIAKKKKPLLMSTGTASLKEVRETLNSVKRIGNPNIVLMQCTASYPAALESLNLRSILTMKNEFKIPVGLSDHSREPDIAPLAAVSMGADCIEKHFTLSNRLSGPDHRFALEPKELKLMVQKIRSAEKALGDGKKVPQPSEYELLRFARRSIFAVRDIRRGECFTKENTATLRCGVQKGRLNPAEYKNILSKPALRDVRANQPIQTEDYAS